MLRTNYECDLHCHTNRSDGIDSPKELIDKASDLGMKVVAITDHDITPPKSIVVENECIDILEYASSKGIQLMRGIEVSCDTDLEDVHIVAFGCDFDHPSFNALEEFVQQSKVNGYKEFVKRLNDYGFQMEWEDLLTYNGKEIKETEIQKKMIFNKCAELGYVASWKDAKVLSQTVDELKVKRLKPKPEDVIRQIKATGGISILAHPKLIKLESKALKAYIANLIEAGLDGIEATYSYSKTNYTGNQTDDEIKHEILETYGNLNLIISGGSDYHGISGKGIERMLGENGISYEEYQHYNLDKYCK